jgi:hypothetical protein
MSRSTPTRRGQSGRSRVSKPKKTTASTRSKKPGRRPERRLSLGAFRIGLRARLGRQADDVWGLVLIVVGLIVGLAFLGEAGPLGAFFDQTLRFLFGVWGYVVPVFLMAVGASLIVGRPRDGAGRLVIGWSLVFIAGLALFHLLTGAISLAASIDGVRRRGGAVGAVIAFPLRRMIGTWGAGVVLSAGVAAGVLIASRTKVREARGHRPPARGDPASSTASTPPDQDRPGPTVTRYEIELAPRGQGQPGLEPLPRHRLRPGHPRCPPAGADPGQERHRGRSPQPRAVWSPR